MNKFITTINQRGGHVLIAMAVLLSVGMYSCDSLVNVTDPDIVRPEALNNEASIQTLRAGTLSDFAQAMSGSGAGHGSTPGMITMSGLMGDEYDYVGTFPSRKEADARNVRVVNVEVDLIYSNMHRARVAALLTLQSAAAFGGSPAVESEMHSVVGYVYLMFAETFCSGVPFSTALADGTLEFGMPQTTEQMFTTAFGHFENALSRAQVAANPTLAHLAHVGMARAQLGLGKISEAAAIAKNVPDNFVYNMEYTNGTLRQLNGIYVFAAFERQNSIADGKGVNGLKYRSANDPRTPWGVLKDSDGELVRGQDDISPYYNQLRFPAFDTPVPLASGIEARLIEAEAAMQAGDNMGVQTIHNALRATMNGLPADNLSAMTQDELRVYHFKERAFWLYSTGHRQGDLRRLVRVYGQAVTNVFPTGPYFKEGGSYDSNVTFPVPITEENNPNFKGCLNNNP